MASGWTELKVDGSAMKTYVATPQGGGPFPGVVVAQHAGAVDEFIINVCDRLAEAGFVAAAPDMYHRQQGMTFEELSAMPKDHPDRWDTMMGKAGKMKDDEIASDVNAAIAHLKGIASVGASPIGITGFCGGGRVAYMMAGRNPELQASAVFHGGNIMVARGDGPSPFEQTAQISCRVAGFFGRDDQNPSADDVAKISAEMDKHAKAHEFHMYDGTGHSFLDFTNPTAFREDAAKDAWGKLVGFFEETLKAPAAV
jgi:carboxymethylenebutenolidase